MKNNATIDSLKAMRFSAMAAELEQQIQDPSTYTHMGLEERIALLVDGHGGKFCVSVFRQNQEYHVFNVHDGGLFPLVTSLPEGWDGMRADTA